MIGVASLLVLGLLFLNPSTRLWDVQCAVTLWFTLGNDCSMIIDDMLLVIVRVTSAALDRAAAAVSVNEPQEQALERFRSRQ